MKRFLIACVLTFAAFVNISAQICPPEISFLKQLAPRVAEFEARGCTDLRIRQVGRDLWEISKYQEVIMPSSVAVSGAGTAEVNGTYTYRGLNGGYPYYNLIGQPDHPTQWSVRDIGTAWQNYGSVADFALYVSGDGPEYPWQATWEPNEGEPPEPTFTEVPVAAAFPPSIFAKQAVRRASSY